MKHVVVTGGAGFIGSHLCETLLNKGYAVTAVDNLLTGREANLDSIKSDSRFSFVRKNISEGLSEKELPLFSKHGLDGVFHFACPASPVDFSKFPFDILHVDSFGTFHTVQLCLRHHAKYLLASTSEIYGDPLVHPQKEDYWGNVNPIGPRACYDETKRFAEAYVSSAMRGSGTFLGKNYDPLNGRIVRIFNTYGPRMRADDGRLIPELCMRALQGKPLLVHGDGKQTRSFCYVSDLVDGIIRLYESEEKNPVNLGNPIEQTILEFVETLQKVSKKDLGIEYSPGRPDDPRRRCPDISRAKSSLNWEPQIDLEEGLHRSLEYFHSL